MVVAVLLTGWSTPSQAGNPYASTNIGITWFDDIEGEHMDADESRFSIETGTNSGIALTGAIGYDMGSTRGEIELGYQTNEAEILRLYKDGEFDKDWEATGDISLTTLMLNGYYDIDAGESTDLEFFLTAGFGVAFCNFDDVGELKDKEIEDNDRIGTLNTSAFAYQFGAGVAYPVSEELTIEGRYRYFQTGDFSTNSDFNGFYMRDDDDAYNMDITSHSALIGLRYNF